MKKNYVVTMTLLMIAISGCSVKSTNSKTSSSTSSSTSTLGSSGSSSGSGSGSTSNVCDGIPHDGATRCYYKNLPTIQVMGQTTAAIRNGVPLWNSRSLGTSISQGQFNTDARFNIRIVPRMAVKTNPAANPSVAGKSCNHLMSSDYIASKLYVQVKIQTLQDYTSGSANGQVATMSASIDAPSAVYRFDTSSLPNDADHPLVLKVVSVLTDSRCRQPNGTNYCPFSDLPLSSPTTTAPTECVAFDIQYATDETYDLPN